MFGEWSAICQLFSFELQGARVLNHCQSCFLFTHECHEFRFLSLAFFVQPFNVCRAHVATYDVFELYSSGSAQLIYHGILIIGVCLSIEEEAVPARNRATCQKKNYFNSCHFGNLPKFGFKSTRKSEKASYCTSLYRRTYSPKACAEPSL